MAKKLDDLLKDFEKEAEQAVSSNRPLWEGGRYSYMEKTRNGKFITNNSRK